MPRKLLGADVFNMAVDRMVALYREGHRVVVSFSGGKDSCCTLEVCILAAKETGRLPVEVALQDEEIAYPGTYEYAERVAARPEVDFNWFVMHQPMLNVFNRKVPYFWVFDPQLPEEQWVRKPPAFAKVIPHIDISMMTIPERFPPAAGKQLYAAIGLRTQESRGRLYGLHQSGGYVSAPNPMGTRSARPIYDWSDGDVWKAIHENGWDYNHAYNTLFQMGVKPAALRIAPPSMNASGIGTLAKAAAAWPKWFGRVCTRLPGVRTAAQFGKRVVMPSRRLGETWEQTFQRECVDEAPQWIRDRAVKLRDMLLSAHGRHATMPFPEVTPCYTCHNNNGSWKKLTHSIYNGDPFSTKTAHLLPYVEPSFFRPGAGQWFQGGKNMMF